MPDVADDLIAEALDALEVEDVSAMRGGGQKSVRLVRKGDEQLVLKVIALGSSTPAALRRAQREVELLQSLDSPHIVRVESDLVELGDPVRGAAWLEECLDGQDLGAVVGHPWDWDEAVKVASDVAIGLGAAHAAKVVHRDLSANNVRRLSTGRYKVMDFGFARFTLLSGVTVGGQPGTPGYFTPEHVHTYSGGPTAASDVFSVGALLMLALTGETAIPYRGDDADYFRRLLAIEVVDIDAVRPDLTQEQRDLVKRCLHPQSARRFRNGQRLAEAIAAVS